MKIGCFLSCEEFGPRDLIENAKRAEQAGFHALWISDHFHPWNDEQGHSAFVWSVIGALAEAVDLPVTTGVTCPTVRIHPAIIAQAAATSAVMTGGVCFMDSEEEARKTVHRLWPNEALPGELAQVLPQPAHFEQATELVTEEMIAESVPCGPDVDKIAETFQSFADAGFDELYVQQIGPDQRTFFDLLKTELLPRFA